jgi:hypothetical protein
MEAEMIQATGVLYFYFVGGHERTFEFVESFQWEPANGGVSGIHIWHGLGYESWVFERSIIYWTKSGEFKKREGQS